MMAAPAIGIAELLTGKTAGVDGFHRTKVRERTWHGLAAGCAAGHQDLGGMWFDSGAIQMLLFNALRKIRAIVSLAARTGVYPSVGCYHAPAIRLERALRDLHGTDPRGLPDTRAWLDHGVWPSAAPGRKSGKRPALNYEFLSAEGDGLHQIPVGPVHAGIIEPGHFRFTANGEAIVRLEERLGYAHKGIEALCMGADIDRAARLAARISGDSTVAYSFAFARAIEAALGSPVPRRAQLLRGITAELERLANHINDVGAICNDASVVVLHARCTHLREQILQVSKSCFGHRLMMDCIVPGGVSRDLAPEGRSAIEQQLKHCAKQFEAVVHVYEEAPSLQDRTVTTGIVRPALAAQFAAGGYIGRASGRKFDTRAVFPHAPYDMLKFTMAGRIEGDVDARFMVRVDEVRSSIDLIGQMLALLKAGSVLGPAPALKAGEGAAMIEGFRGDIFIRLRLDRRGRVAHFHARDPSWFQWPLLEAAIEGNIVADFPLCNKSFNCSYSGHDM